MKHILARKNLPLLERFAWSNVLLAFDFDGTLAPIVREPDDARLPPSTRGRMRRLAAAYPCAVISGRSRHDLEHRLAGLKLVEIVGNHGSETAGRPPPHARRVGRWAGTLREDLKNVPGIEIEEKGASLAIHYRKARARREAVKQIDLAIAALGGPVRVIGGKLVVNLMPVNAPHKGIALRKVRKQAGADTAIFVGDDLTDEDVFEMDEPGRLLSIRVGRSAASAAPYCLNSQREIDLLLDALLAFERMRGEHA